MALSNNELTVRCTACKVDLVDILLKGAVNAKKLRVRCPICKDLTFFHKVSDDIGYHQCNNFCVTDIVDENNLIVIEMTK